MEPLGFMMVRGVSVDICAKKIINYNFRRESKNEKDFPLRYTDYDKRMKNSDDHRVWAASVIAKETPNWIDPIVGIHKNTLTNEINFWLAIISSRVFPSFNDTNIMLEKALMIAALMTRSKINVGEIIQDEIRDRARVPRIYRIYRYTEPKQTVDYTRLEYGNKRKIIVPQSQATPIVLDTEILGSVDQPSPVSTSVPDSTSFPQVLAPTTETVSTKYMSISSVPTVGPGIPTYSMRLIFMVEDKVMKLVEEFLAYVKEAIQTALAPHKANLEAVRAEQKSIKAQL
ncbi:hypothetical protein RND71_009732 [Anisodus tanguticus]|uniref:Putative plant transposon protein domain-containing protein n=1 Tax=Anisodus tanguticus TaxID=243964 RepID=A0AAE1SIB1_9SOLA|nr:hypothetical protein RND71_009732 [Anisodus tanguticus]